VLEGVYISNPASFIAAAFTNTDPVILKEKKVSAKFQLYRLEDTKATVARSIFNNHKTVGDDATFYEALSTYIKQYSKSMAVSAKYEMSTSSGGKSFKHMIRYAAAVAEGCVNKTFGRLTNWGSSAITPLVCLFSSFVFYCGVYRVFFVKDIKSAAAVSFDVTTIAGFTRSVTADVNGYFYLATCANLVCSILFYSAFFSVAINKISRLR
jgi:hypothetical protein